MTGELPVAVNNHDMTNDIKFSFLVLAAMTFSS